MATAAFRSSTKRSTFADEAAGDARPSNRSAILRSSRSLSRHITRHTPTSSAVAAEHEEFPDISLDDLAHEFFLGRYKEEESLKMSGRSSRRRDGFMSTMEGDASRRRGKSVSAGERKGLLENGERNRGTSGARLRRQRSISVARQRFSDSEGRVEESGGVCNHWVGAMDGGSWASNDWSGLPFRWMARGPAASGPLLPALDGRDCVFLADSSDLARVAPACSGDVPPPKTPESFVGDWGSCWWV